MGPKVAPEARRNSFEDAVVIHRQGSPGPVVRHGDTRADSDEHLHLQDMPSHAKFVEIDEESESRFSELLVHGLVSAPEHHPATDPNVNLSSALRSATEQPERFLQKVIAFHQAQAASLNTSKRLATRLGDTNVLPTKPSESSDSLMRGLRLRLHGALEWYKVQAPRNFEHGRILSSHHHAERYNYLLALSDPDDTQPLSTLLCFEIFFLLYPDACDAAYLRAEINGKIDDQALKSHLERMLQNYAMQSRFGSAHIARLQAERDVRTIKNKPLSRSYLDFLWGESQESVWKTRVLELQQKKNEDIDTLKRAASQMESNQQVVFHTTQKKETENLTPDPSSATLADLITTYQMTFQHFANLKREVDAKTFRLSQSTLATAVKGEEASDTPEAAKPKDIGPTLAALPKLGFFPMVAASRGRPTSVRGYQPPQKPETTPLDHRPPQVD